MHFIYEKPNGEVSERFVYMIRKPSDLYFGIDLSEYNSEERAYYEKQLRSLFSNLDEEIHNMGLGSNYRNFKKERITHELE